jgi:hypothetical protein
VNVQDEFVQEYILLKRDLAVRYADLIYNDVWLTPTREAIDAFVASVQTRVTGTVRLKLFKGSLLGWTARRPARSTSMRLPPTVPATTSITRLRKASPRSEACPLKSRPVDERAPDKPVSGPPPKRNAAAPGFRRFHGFRLSAKSRKPGAQSL